MDFLVFRLNDLNQINNILGRNVSSRNDKQNIRDEYMKATEQRGNFFRIDCVNNRFYRNFTEPIEL